MTRSLRLPALLLALTTTAALTACGGGATGGSTGAATAPDPAFVTSARTAIDATRGTQELGSPPPAQAAVPGKKVTVIVCAAAAEGCAIAGDAAKAAGQSLGWTVDVVDGQSSPTVQNTAMLQAIAAGSNGIVLAAVDASSVGEGLARASAQGVPVVAVSSAVTAGTGPGDVFSFYNYRGQTKGELAAQWVVADSAGTANVGRIESPDLDVFRQYDEGAAGVFSSCTSCTVAPPTNYALATASQDIPLRVKTLLQSNPAMNYLYVDFAVAAEAAAVAANELNRQVKIVTDDCFSSTFDAVRRGDVDACVASAIEMSTWREMDNLNRAFAKVPATDVGPAQIKVFDATNVPASGGWVGDGDFAGMYRSAWGVRP